MIENSYDGRRKVWRVTSVFVSLTLHSEGQRLLFYLDLANHVTKGSDSYQTYAALLLLEYVESIDSPASEKRTSVRAISAITVRMERFTVEAQMCLMPMNPQSMRSRTGAAKTCIALNRPQSRPMIMRKKATT